MSTLSVDGTGREDVTHRYKHPEGSPAERVAVEKAVGMKTEEVDDTTPKDVDFQLWFDAENTFVGDVFRVELRAKNRSQAMRTVGGALTVSSMYYTGVVSRQVGEQRFEDVKLKAGETKAVTVRVDPDTYHPMLKDCCMLSLSAMARVKETKQIFTKKDNARLRKPHLNIKAPASASINKEVGLEVSFTNPLGKTLTDCSLEVEGPGLGTAKSYPQGDVAPKGTFTTTVKLKPRKKGKKDIVAVFNSRELEDVNGSVTITIKA